MLFEMHALNVHFCRRLPVVLCVVIFLIHYLWIAKLNHHCLKFVFRTPDMLLNSDPTSFFLFLGTVILFWRSWKSPCCTEAGAHSISGKAINPRILSSVASALPPTEDGGSCGRSGSLSAPPRVIEEAVQKIDVNPPKGTRDFPPEEMRLRNWLFHNFREVINLPPSL